MKASPFLTRVACIAVVVNPRGELLFLRRSTAETFAAGKWDFPGGSKEFLESAEEGTMRECWEECGLRVSVQKLVHFQVHEAEQEPSTEFVLFSFLCKPEHELRVVLSDEHDAYRWLRISQARTLPLVYWMPALLDKLERRQDLLISGVS